VKTLGLQLGLKSRLERGALDTLDGGHAPILQDMHGPPCIPAALAGTIDTLGQSSYTIAIGQSSYQD